MEEYYGIFKKVKNDYPELVNEYPLYYKESVDIYEQLCVFNNDINNFLQQALLFGGPILELCCGSGRLTLPLLKLGFKVTAVDLSEDMLSNLKLKLSNRKYLKFKENLTIVVDDMTKIKSDEKYNFIVIGATSIKLVEEELCEFFDKMYEILNDGGCLFFDCEDIPIKENEEVIEPMIISDFINKDKKLALICIQRILNYKEKRAVVNFFRIIPATEEKILLSYSTYRIFGIEDIKDAVRKSKFKTCKIINSEDSNNFFCKMIKK